MKQEEALTLLKMGKNVFLTGAAGTGKTYVLNQYIKFLKERGVDVAVTASTGIASTHIGGMTIHSWAGIGIKDYLTDRDLDAMEEKQYLWERFKNVKVLIIDEISMLKSSTLEMIDQVCRFFKRNNEPFGGIQIVFSGDFFQLPPIVSGLNRDQSYLNSNKQSKTKNQNQDIFYEEDSVYQDPDAYQENKSSGIFAFSSESWKSANLHTCYLKKQFRQNDDGLLSILNEIREGEITEKSHKLLKDRIFKPNEAEESGISENMTKLYSHNKSVDHINNQELSKIKGEEKKYSMEGRGKPHLVASLKKNCLAPEDLCLRIGALVMFVKNNPVQGYVNGTVGAVIGYKEGYPLIKTKKGEKFIAYPDSWAIEDQGKLLAEVSQVPLKLAWAVTIHKSQGMTLSQAFIDLSKAFVAGQGYVALSRVKSLDGLFLEGFNDTALEISEEVINIDLKFKNDSDISVSRLSKTEDGVVSKYLDDFLEAIDAKEPNPENLKQNKLEKKVKKAGTYKQTEKLIKDKKNIKEISKERDISEDTIIEHVTKLLDQKVISIKDINYLKPKTKKFKEELKIITKAFKDLKKDNPDNKLKPIFEELDQKYEYDTIKLVKLFVS